MTSKISMRKLMREDLRRRTWMTTLSLLGSFLASPVAFLLFNNGLGREPYYINNKLFPASELAEYNAETISAYLYGGHSVTQLIILFAGAIIVACAGFRHLFSRRMSDLYHSAPVSRNRLFLAVWLDGFLIWFVPFLAGNLCVYAMALFKIGMPAYWGGVTMSLVKLMLLCVLCFLIVYNACLVPVMLSGNATNTFVNILFYGLVVFVGYLTLIGYMEYFETFFVRETTFTQPLVIGLSPLAAPVYLFLYFADEIMCGYTDAIVISSLFTVINFFLALWLHKKRASELAERGLENKGLRIAMRFAVSFFSGLLLSLFFAALTHKGWWALFGAVFGSVLAFALCNIIYHAGFKYVLSHRLQLAACVLLTCALVLSFRYDVLGYDRYVPSEADITGLSLYCDVLKDNGYDFIMYEKGKGYPPSLRTTPPEDYCFTDPKAIHTLLELLSTAPGPEESGGSASVNVRVDTTHGSYFRRYKLYDTAEHREALKPILESESYRKIFFPAAEPDWPLPELVCIDSLDDVSIDITDKNRIQELLSAYQKDFQANYSVCTVTLRHCPLTLDCRYPENNRYRDVYLYLPYGSTAAALLEEWYPDQIWSPERLEFTSLKIELEYTGSEQIRTGYVDDPGELAAWMPYLIVGQGSYFFNEQETVFVGYAKTASDSRFRCYAKKGSLPQELLESLKPAEEK